MRLIVLTLVGAAICSVAAWAQAPVLRPELSGLAFLVGHWTDGQGDAVDMHSKLTGVSSFTAEAGGAVILRRDHTNLVDGAGRPVRGFDQIMTIFAEGGALRADDFDPNHIIHYVSAKVQPGKSVVFSSAASNTAPVFRLAYTLAAPHVLSVEFSMMPPGGSSYRTIATGSLHEVEKAS